MRKKILIILAIVFIILPILMYAVLRTSYMQNYLTQRITAYLSKELQTEITVGKVDVSFFLNIVLEDVSVKDRKNNTLLQTDKLTLHTGRISLRNKVFGIRKLSFQNPDVRIIKYKGEDDYNFRFLVDYFTSDPEKEPDVWGFLCDHFLLFDSKFKLINENVEVNQVNDKLDFNRILLTDFNIDISDVSFGEDEFEASFNHLSFVESSGLVLKNLKGLFKYSSTGAFIENMTLITNNSKLVMDANMDYESPEDFNNFADDVSFTFNLSPSHISLADLDLFLHDIEGKDDDFRIKGNLSGRLSNLRAREFMLVYGESTILDGDFFASGLPNIDNTFINLSVNRFSTTRHDIDRFANVADIKNIESDFYDYLTNLGNIMFNGNLTGFLNDFVAYGDLNTGIGTIKSDIAIFDEDGNGDIGYNGSLSVIDFDIGKLLNQSKIFGKVDMNLLVNGTGFSFEKADLTFDSNFDYATINNYSYSNINFKGSLKNKQVDADFLLNDPNAFVELKGMVDFYKKPFMFDINADISDLNLTGINLYQRDSLYNSTISTTLNLNFLATKPDDLEGEIAILNTNYIEEMIGDSSVTESYYFDQILLTNNFFDNKRDLNLITDILDLNINGNLRFEYIAEATNKFFAGYMPAWYGDRLHDLFDSKYDMDFNYNLKFKDVSLITDIFIPELYVSDNSKIEGHFNNKINDLSVKGDFNELAYNNSVFKNFSIEGRNNDEFFTLETGSSEFFISDSLWMHNFVFTNSIKDNSLKTSVEWINQDKRIRNEGSVKTVVDFHEFNRFDLKFLTSHFFVNDSLWSFKEDNLISVHDDKYIIDNLVLYKGQEHIQFDGEVSRNPKDELSLQFKNFDLSNFDYFFERNNISFDGMLSGSILISNPYETPNVSGNAKIIDFGFNEDHLGDLVVSTKYDRELEGFEVDLEVIYHGSIGYNKPIVGSGYYFPDRENDNFDLDFNVENLRLSMFGRYLDGFAQNFRGMASGPLRLEGPVESPELSGNLRLARTGFRVDYLKTSYTFAHTIEIGKDYFAFDNMVINDTIGNRARANGKITHNNFRNFALNVEIFPDNLVLLNTTPAHNEMYYGSAFATGRAHIHGPVDNIVMDISARTNRNTKFFLPLTYRGDIKESNYITFVSSNDNNNNNNDKIIINNEGNPEHVVDVSGLTVNFDLEVTPDAEVQLIFDSQIGDIIRSRGEGNIRLEISSQGAFNMYGDYTISEGDYLFTLQNMLNKRFRIQEGGNIRWTGDPMDAEIDLRALYRVRTALFELVREVDTSDVYRRRMPIDVVLQMENDLFNPDITFDIDLPQSDESTREMVDRLIITEQEMNRQIFSLLVLNSFMPTNPDQYNTSLGYGVGMTSTEMLSNQISNWLSQISTDFDIGINYRPGDEISSQELEVALSTQFFDDRLIVDGNVGVTEDNPAAAGQRASNIIGDVNIEYKVTPEGRFRIKAFNRSNTMDILNTNALYTQGIGVFYRREFDNLDELLRNRKKEEFSEPTLPESDVQIPEHEF